MVKTLLRRCVRCLKLTGMSYKSPDTPQLPKFRPTEGPPFTACGVHFTGTLYYKATSIPNKSYICLFTCAVTRAVHLEVVGDLSTQTFLRAFRRFAARRSTPRHLISDNGSTFIAGAKQIQDLCENSEVINFLASRKVEWTFILKRAPWFGGFYERLIGLTKTSLTKCLGRALVTLDELVTVVTEIETMINERPLTYVSSEANEPDPLTPSMLVNGRSLITLPRENITVDELHDLDYGVNNTLMTKRARRLDLIFQQCWCRWRSEYLPALREIHALNAKQCKLGQSTNIIKIGDVVVVHSDDKRVQWPLAVVTELNKGGDVFVRSANIRTKYGLTNRPITKLYPLELNDTLRESEEQTVSSSDVRRPSRQAAIEARQKWINQLS